MKKTIALLLLSLGLAGCQSETDFGDCIGAFDDPNPDLIYRVSTRNVIVEIVFAQTVIVPAVVVLDQARCPVGRRAK